jgi:hypothetical protein
LIGCRIYFGFVVALLLVNFVGVTLAIILQSRYAVTSPRDLASLAAAWRQHQVVAQRSGPVPATLTSPTATTVSAATTPPSDAPFQHGSWDAVEVRRVRMRVARTPAQWNTGTLQNHSFDGWSPTGTSDGVDQGFGQLPPLYIPTTPAKSNGEPLESVPLSYGSITGTQVCPGACVCEHVFACLCLASDPCCPEFRAHFTISSTGTSCVLLYVLSEDADASTAEARVPLFCSNAVYTAKYNIITFLPVFLFAQFRYLAFSVVRGLFLNCPRLRACMRCNCA